MREDVGGNEVNIRHTLARTLYRLAKRLDPSVNPHVLSAEDSARLRRDLENVCSPEEADRRKRWAREQRRVAMQPKRPLNAGCSAPARDPSTGTAAAEPPCPPPCVSGFERAPRDDSDQNAVSEPLRASNRVGDRPQIEVHRVLSRWRAVIQERLPCDYPALAADLQWLLDRPETPAETAARVRREGSVSMREMAQMPDENLKAAVEALMGRSRE